MKRFYVSQLFDTSKTIARQLFEDCEYPWHILDKLGKFIVELGNTLDPEVFYKKGENIWIAKDATVFDSAYINGPCIIDQGAEIRHCAFIRGNVIVGKSSVVGNSSEVKNSVIFDCVQAPHYNYVGDSVLGYKSHMGAGSITSNIKSDKTDIVIKTSDVEIATGMRKIGAMIGDRVEIGCGSVLNPGVVIGKDTNVYPLSCVRGYVAAGSIYKKAGEIVKKK
ncbi:MAG: UDP-N-acetylglucosamine pyrophosphorylase [bacterium]|nr:UDP-N-acetylglucosamine pyrophosphorylase [bacterium]